MEFLINSICTLLIIISLFATCVGIICAFEHGDLKAISEKPISDFDKKTLRKFLKTGTLAGLVVLMCLILRAILRDQDIIKFFLSIGIYKAFLIPTCWVISYLLPSKRKSIVKKRSKIRKTST